jgi:hypothetical protein
MVKLLRCEVVELRRVLVFGGHYATPGITRTDTVGVVHGCMFRRRLDASDSTSSCKSAVAASDVSHGIEVRCALEMKGHEPAKDKLRS